MKIGIVGHGAVGSAVARLFRGAGNEIVVFDRFVAPFDGPEQQPAINTCDLVFLCVPTPPSADGSCDLSAVEECAGWITAPLCVRSTIPPGTVDRLTAATGSPIAFSPEYLGESASHPWREDTACGFLIVGGAPLVCDLVVSAYRSLPEPIRVYRTTARTAELCKYMENCFLAAKVAFVNQFYDIAGAFGVDFEELRKLWLADPRIGASHTEVTPERGFGGRCLPKDLSAMVAAMRPHGGAPLLEALMAYNAQVREPVATKQNANGCTTRARCAIQADDFLRGLWERELAENGDPGHDAGHLLRVAEWTLRIGDGETQPKEALAAALLHDRVNVPKNSPDRSRASELSAGAARPILEEAGFEPDAIERIAAAIRDHSFSRGATPESPLGQALQDADRLDALGAIGVVRTIATGVRMGGRAFDLDDPWAERRPLDDQAYSLDHFFTKLLLLPEKMNTEAGRREAQRRAQWMRGFLREVAAEIGAPLPESAIGEERR